MRIPNFATERKRFAAGCDCLAGLDEVGRGAWAGPLVAAAVVLTADKLIGCRRLRRLVRDSKTLSQRQREHAYTRIAALLGWGVGVVAPGEIDRHGLTMANQLAMERAIAALPSAPAFLFVDGRGFHFTIPNRQIIDGDARVFCIAAASIIAKVTRDRLMRTFDRQYPAYGFANHKGYGTPRHQTALTTHGPCPIHRQAFAPIAERLATMVPSLASP